MSKGRRKAFFGALLCCWTAVLSNGVPIAHTLPSPNNGHGDESSVFSSQRSLDETTTEEGESTYQLYDENGVNEKCTEFLLEFLEGTTDFKDTCEGIHNAYAAAECESVAFTDDTTTEDDYFGEFYEHKCCQSLLELYAEYCEDDRPLTNLHLLLAASGLLLCEIAKSLVKRNDIKWLPEAAVCILVGVVLGGLARVAPFVDVDSISFDEELFLTVLLPPIIFEAALSVSKQDFRRRGLAIFMLAVLGTIFSSLITGFMVHFLSRVLPNTTTLPRLDSLVFGALISSIDPVAILSVLSELNLDQTDIVFILVLGESLLNDGVAITMSQTLIERYGQEGLTFDDVLGAVADFLIVGFGSTAVGFLCSLLSLVYFWLFRRLLNPGMEVGSFFLWALVPYWICDGLGWSGIVAIVTAGFFMDYYITAKPKATNRSTEDLDGDTVFSDSTSSTASVAMPDGPGRPPALMYKDADSFGVQEAAACRAPCTPRSLADVNLWNLLDKTQKVRLSPKADKHVRFVAHLLAQLAENFIFAYLGLFLFSQNYNWDMRLVSVSVFSCVAGRAIMVVMCGLLIWQVNYYRRCSSSKVKMSRTALHLTDRNTQLILIFAGLRGAVSLALVESVPIYNSVTGEGSEFKPLLKAMTSASIIFTVFVFGGSAHFVFPHLGIQPNDDDRSVASYQSRVDSQVQLETEMGYYPPKSLFLV